MISKSRDGDSGVTAGGDCLVGDTGPGGGTVFYVASSPFTCAPDQGSKCTYLEAENP